MKRSIKTLTTMFVVACCTFVASSAPVMSQGLDFSFNGSFTADDDVQLFEFSIDTQASVTLRSVGYAGGLNAAEESVSAGGFDPILTLFDADLNVIDVNDDGLPPNVGIDPVSGISYDPFLESDLAAGNYTVALTQFDNFHDGLTDDLSLGFGRDGEPNFTFTDGFGTAAFFNDFGGNARTGNWAFDILNVSQASAVAVPEPSCSLLLMTAFGMNFVRRKRAI